MKVYTVEEVASILRLEQKTVLHLIKRGFLKALPGIRHKRIPEAELDRYMNVRSILAGGAGNGSGDLHSGAGQTVVGPTGHSARPSNGNGVSNGQIVVKSNGEGSGAASRVVKPKGRK
ncbi:MAG: helix-turn-helix domain-containing protein [Verrucomicrobiia bacterium]